VFIVVLVLSASATLIPGEPSPDGWTQWGGPDQDFRASSRALATTWPEDGPRQLWSRELGEGYSAILVEKGRLYTMYRAGDEEAVVCLDAVTGETVWEHRYAHAPREGHIGQFGDGPRSTPLIDGKRIYTIGVAGLMHALNKKDGKVLWSHDLWAEYGGNFLEHGYASSPIAYGDTVIALVGGEDQAIVAFDKKDGRVAWKGLDFRNSYSTPRVLDVGGADQLVTFMADALIGVDPDNGELEWQYPHRNQWNQNIAMPVMVDDYLFLSSPEAGARGLRLSRKDGKTEIEEVWATRKIQFYHGSTVRDGDYVYGSTGTMAPAFMAAVNIKTGEIAWRKRGFAKANVIHADGRLIILDEDGKLYLTTATPQDLKVHSEVELLNQVSWTVPTIVGKTMYVRDQVNILALDLG
jgi:outer membrane protein assembly factor BamB